ncbi:MAG: 50S ribosomal protein L5 [Clostridia bacterium]|nr:50S ribosomal protein L5 [Clostridia bacterium]MCL6521248.1 50S ribosomal protein L5 [Bacillota bacterium]
MNSLRERYLKEIRPGLQRRFGYRNIMEVPRLEKIVVNMGVGAATRDPKLLDGAVRDLAAITGQKPLVTKARKSVAAFKVRTGMSIGAKVTLRGERMYDFLEKLVSVVLPRVRDFHGVSPDAFDGRGNYSLGLREQLVFPEIEYDKIDQIRGMDITLVTTARTDEEAKALLEELGVPFRAA